MTHQEAVASLAAERYLLDEMPDDQRDAFEAHFFSCDECAADMRAAAALVDGAGGAQAGASGRATVVPIADHQRSRNGGWRRSIVLPWAVAAGLAGMVTYQAVRVTPGVPGLASPTVLAPVTLRPESRGAEPVVPRPAGAQPVSLAIEVNDAPAAGTVRYDLATADGRAVVSGQAPAPQAGSPLLLLMPAWTLTGSMHYILSVHDTAAPGRPLGEYRFAVSPQ